MNLFIEFMTYNHKKTTHNFIVFIFDKNLYSDIKKKLKPTGHIHKFEKVKQFEYRKKGPVIAILIIIDSRNKKTINFFVLLF